MSKWMVPHETNGCFESQAPICVENDLCRNVDLHAENFQKKSLQTATV